MGWAKYCGYIQSNNLLSVKQLKPPYPSSFIPGQMIKIYISAGDYNPNIFAF